jgi:hypothetical protein
MTLLSLLSQMTLLFLFILNLVPFGYGETEKDKETPCFIDLDCLPLAPKGYFCCKSTNEKVKMMACCQDCKRTKFPDESCNLKQPFPVWAILCGIMALVLIIVPAILFVRKYQQKKARLGEEHKDDKTDKTDDDEEEENKPKKPASKMKSNPAPSSVAQEESTIDKGKPASPAKPVKPAKPAKPAKATQPSVKGTSSMGSMPDFNMSNVFMEDDADCLKANVKVDASALPSKNVSYRGNV